jgi:quercetin dioxygenase-like cupin family protein
MYHLKRLIVATVLLPFGAVLAAGAGPAQAQDSAPPSTEPMSMSSDSMAAEPIAKETLGSGESAVAPDRVLLLSRRTFAPGADSGEHPAPGPVVLFVESGTIGFTVIDGAALVTRAYETPDSSETSEAPEGPETVAEGTEYLLSPGDSVFYDEGVVHTVRNAGDVEAVTLEARLNPPA